MTVKYNYICNECKSEYVEQRGAEDVQIFTDCQTCESGTYNEVSSEVISNSVERAPGPEPEPAELVLATPIE